MNEMIILIGIAAVLATFLGGMFALRFKDKLHLVLGLSAGAVIGVAFFDLMPEALELAGEVYSVSLITSVMAIGFVFFMLLDRTIALHSHDAELDDTHHHTHSRRGFFGAGSLSLHSFLDGLGIGLAFQVSSAVGTVVALAVLAHDFSDGINTVSLVLKNNGSKAQAFKWLVVDAIAPALGVISTLFFSLPAATLGLVLAVFCGFFLYIGASDLLPESYHGHPTLWTTLTTILGILFLYVIIHVAAI